MLREREKELLQKEEELVSRERAVEDVETRLFSIQETYGTEGRKRKRQYRLQPDTLMNLDEFRQSSFVSAFLMRI